MEYTPIDFQKKERILNKAGPRFFKMIEITAFFMTVLVMAEVISRHDKQNILALRTPEDQKDALLNHLYQATVGQFIAFCITLHDELGQPDIIMDVFGLNIDHLKMQKDEEEARMARETQSRTKSQPSEASARAGGEACRAGNLEEKTDVAVMVISQRKRMVVLDITSSHGLTKKEIKEALMSQHKELTKHSLHVAYGSVHFKDDILTALACEIIQKRHLEDDLGKKIDFDTQYVKLKMLSLEEMTTVKRDELERPDKYQSDLQKNSGKDISDEEVIAPGETRKYILIRGRAGIGKTTLVQRFMWKWAHGEWGKLRILMAVMPNVDLPHLLTCYAVYRIGQHGATVSAEWLEENQCQVGIVLDGLDKIHNFTELWEKEYGDFTVETEAPAIFWGFALMKRVCLQTSTLIVTSRPFADLNYIQPTIMVEVMGLTRERVMEFVDRNVKIERVNMVKQSLINNPILLSVSAITFYCVALCQVLQDDIGVTDKLTTYTQITACILERFIQHSVKESAEGDAVTKLSSSLKAVARLAYEGLIKRNDRGVAKLVFDKEDFVRHNLKQEDVDNARRAGLFLQTKVPDMTNTQVLGEFVHLSIQEFLAMAGLLMQSPQDVQEALKTISTSGQFNMALIFLYGFAFNRSSEVIKRLCTAIGVGLDSGKEVGSLLQEKILDVADDLQILQMVHESQSPEVARHVGQNRFPMEVELWNCKVTVVDIIALIFLLKHNQSIFIVRLLNVDLDAVCMKEFGQLLKGNTSVSNIYLEDNGIDDECMKYLAEGLSENMAASQLKIFSDNVTDKGVSLLSTTLKTNTTISYLMIKSDKVTDQGAAFIADVLKTNKALTEVELPGPKFTARGLTSFADSLATNRTLQNLSLSHSELGDEGAEALLQALSVNVKVNIRMGKTSCSEGMQQQLKAHSRMSFME